MIIIYLLISTTIFAAAFAVWNRSDALNTIIKIFLFGLTIYGGICIASDLGSSSSQLLSNK